MFLSDSPSERVRTRRVKGTDLYGTRMTLSPQMIVFAFNRMVTDDGGCLECSLYGIVDVMHV